MQKINDHTDILVGLRKIIRSIHLESKMIQKQYGVSIPQLLCLKYLKNQEEFKATAKDLRNYMNLNASTITGIIGRLEKKGYVAKMPKGADKRMSVVALTALGSSVVDKVPPLLHSKLTLKLKELPKGKLKEIQDAIDLLIEFMGTEQLDASPVIMIQDPSENDN
ncbi:MarR family transcriptional regulator [Paracrocinitomix mangrovi]|uniref:MarR family winged helix-turn-helix transcriptional regulator n=1 Tax=Paracrocinitomix mangrovi TaxID=2862509 RepID=UPI001C8D9E6A|nr:MarR family transcriptional regulator [Paracrocinitomix mangrovi]UKN01393.1 MarR family transcriptional regulator [Paracrocinitomix mangrovi]